MRYARRCRSGPAPAGSVEIVGCEVPPQLALIGGGGEAQLFDQGQNQFGYGGLDGRVGGEIRGAFGPDLAKQALYVGGLIIKDLKFPGTLFFAPRIACCAR